MSWFKNNNKEILTRLIDLEKKIDSFSRPKHDTQEIAEVYLGHPDQFFGPYTYSQYGEDLIIANIFGLLDIPKPSYIDIGAHHPINISNTALFYKRGSRGINIEANPNLIKSFYDLRPDDINLNIGISNISDSLEFYCIDEYSGRNTFNKKNVDEFIEKNPQFSIREIKKIEVKTINEVISKYANGIYPDLLSIDIEGLDYRVLASANFDSSYPKVICAEVTYLKNGENTSELLKKRGYIPYVNTISNIIFVHKSVYQQLTRQR